MSAGRDAVSHRIADAMRVNRERNGLSGAHHELPADPDAVSDGADALPGHADAVPADTDGLSAGGHRVRAATGGKYVSDWFAVGDGESAGRQSVPCGQYDRADEGNEAANCKRDRADRDGRSPGIVGKYALDERRRARGVRASWQSSVKVVAVRDGE
jgi:hypothetical protein